MNLSSSTQSTLSVQVIRGNSSFADACRVAAIGMAMTACASAMASVDKPLDQRVRMPDSKVTAKLQTMLPDQNARAELVSPEQMQTLKYGIYPPVKTTLLVNGKLQTHWTIHPFDLVRLSREAAQQASAIEGIKVDPAKVGAVMMTESSMVSRVGWSANGKTPSYGLGQLETNTSHALGVKDPNDPRESALAVARLVAQGLKFARVNSHVDQNLALSLAYNTSTSLRKSLVSTYGAALRIENLPQATQHHVKNMAYGEQRMSQFSRLSDQHEKLVSRLPSPIQPKEVVMNTANSPSPSTKSLITDFISSNANQARLRYNQQQLEKDGHIQAIPMTAQGLSAMRLAVAAQAARLGQSDNAIAARRDVDGSAAPAMMGRLGQELANLAKSLVAKAQETFAVIKDDLKAASAALSPSPAQNTAGLVDTQAGAAQTMRMAKEHMLQLRRQQMAERLAQQQRPA